MAELPILPTKDEQEVRPMAYECKFTVEARSDVGSIQGEKCVTFDGYASDELYAALIDAMGKVVE